MKEWRKDKDGASTMEQVEEERARRRETNMDARGRGKKKKITPVILIGRGTDGILDE